MKGRSDWLRALRGRVQIPLDRIAAASGLRPAANLAMRLSGRSLPSAPISTIRDDTAKPLRVDTVRGTRGETLDAVLYVVTKAHLNGILAGTTAEIGRIGYAAVIRPRDLLWIGVPATGFEAPRASLEAIGLRCFEPGA